MKTLFDSFQEWLQGMVNACVDGHASRIARLEERVNQLEDVNSVVIGDALGKDFDERVETVAQRLIDRLIDNGALFGEDTDLDALFKDAVRDILSNVEYEVRTRVY